MPASSYSFHTDITDRGSDNYIKRVYPEIASLDSAICILLRVSPGILVWTDTIQHTSTGVVLYRPGRAEALPIPL